MKTTINYISLSIIFSSLLVMEPCAFAARKKKRRNIEADAPLTHEVYSATEIGSPGSDSENDQGLVKDLGPKIKDENLLGGSKDLVSTLPSVTSQVNALETPVKLNEYDAVTPEQVESVASRLKLVEQILRKHKRAYDYRSNTTSELKDVQRYLDKKNHK